MVERAKRGPDSEFRAMVIETLKIQSASISKIQEEMSNINKAIISGDKEQIGIMGRLEFLTLTVAELKDNVKTLAASFVTEKDARNSNDKNQLVLNTKSGLVFAMIAAVVGAALMGLASGFVKFGVPSHTPAQPSAVIGTR